MRRSAGLMLGDLEGGGRQAAVRFLCKLRPCLLPPRWRRQVRRLGRRRNQPNVAVASFLWLGFAGYFRFAFRFFLAVFFFEVLRAVFFAAILRTVVLFFLLIGMKQLPLTVCGRTQNVSTKNGKNMRRLD